MTDTPSTLNFKLATDDAQTAVYLIIDSFLSVCDSLDDPAAAGYIGALEAVLHNEERSASDILRAYLNQGAAHTASMPPCPCPACLDGDDDISSPAHDH